MAPSKTDDAPAERRISSRIASRASAAPPAPAAAPAAASKRKSTTSANKADKETDAKKAKVDDAEPKKDDAPAAAAAKPKASTSGGSGSKQLAKGDKLPDLKLRTDEDKEIDISSIKKAVIFTYPKANTPGCTTQGQCYRDAYEEYKSAGVAVYGLSNDSPKSLANWKAKQNFQYTLISDPERKLVGALTGSKSSTIRSHFVVDSDGKLALSSVGVKPKESSDAAFEVASKL